MTQARPPRAGLTLVEVLVALVVFAVIGIAAFALLDQTLRSDRLTEARLNRLAAVQRALQVMTIDTLQLVPGTLQAGPEGVQFLRRGLMQGRVDGLIVGYRLTGGSLIRDIGPPGADPVPQILLDGVATMAWRFHTEGQDWLPSLPQGPLDAVELVLSLGPDQDLRRIFPLPQDTPPPLPG